jgi:hypothetical protein
MIKWEDMIKMDVIEKVCENVDWCHLAQDRTRRQALVNDEKNI